MSVATVTATMMLLTRSETILARNTPRVVKVLLSRPFQRAYAPFDTKRTAGSKVSGGGNSKALNVALVGGSSTVAILLAYNFLSSGAQPASPSPGSISNIRSFHTQQNKLLKDVNKNSSDTLVLLSEEEVNRKLRAIQESYTVNRAKGILRYDVAQLPSNHPIEDNHIEQIVTVPPTRGVNSKGQEREEEDLYFFGIFDGHGGPFTSAKLSRELVSYVARQLYPIYNSSVVSDSDGQERSNLFSKAIATSFLELDRDIVQGAFRRLVREPSRENALAALPAISGACCLLSIFDSEDSTLRVAVTGDSRALIGGVDSEGRWFVKALSVDQTGDNPTEVSRLKSEHPGEKGVIRRGRILGSLQPSRAFGDYRFKLDAIDGKKLSDLPNDVKMYLRNIPNDLLTPPYVTAEPVITTTKIVPGIKFMVMASDGLFELLTNEEIVALVAKWQERYMPQNGSTGDVSNQLSIVRDISSSGDAESQRTDFRYKEVKDSSRGGYLLEDSNVATHLIRNALSAGGRKDYVTTLVSIPSPMSRKYRDDLTVTVAFFGDSAKDDGSLVVNYDATSEPKPKL